MKSPKITLTLLLGSSLLVGCGADSENILPLSCDTPSNGLQGCWVTECYTQNSTSDRAGQVILEFTAKSKLNKIYNVWPTEVGNPICEGNVVYALDSYSYNRVPDSVQILDNTITTGGGLIAQVLETTIYSDNSTYKTGFIINDNEICFETGYINWTGKGTDFGSTMGHDNLPAVDGITINYDTCLQRYEP